MTEEQNWELTPPCRDCMLELCVFVALALDLPWAFCGANPISHREGNVTIIAMETNDILEMIDYSLYQNNEQLSCNDKCAIFISILLIN